MPEHLLVYTLFSALTSMVPGIAVVAAFTTSLKYGFKSGLWLSLGLVSTSILYFLLSGAGLILLVHDNPKIFLILRYLGIIYLVYLGFSSIISKDTLSLDNLVSYKNYKKQYFSGLALNLSNPKNILFFVAILPQYINIHQSMMGQIAWLTVFAEIPEIGILIMYAYFAYKIKPILIKPKVAKLFNIFIGMLFIMLGVWLAFI